MLFLQVVEPGMYPPIIAAAHLMADAGFQVTVLASPSADSQLRMDDHPYITVHQIAQRPNYVVRKQDYLRYMTSAASVGKQVRITGRTTQAQDSSLRCRSNRPPAAEAGAPRGRTRTVLSCRCAHDR